MSEKPACRECKHASKCGKDRKPMRPGTLYCGVHRKAVMANYSCGQFAKK
jgi:hypothetical protein